MTQAQQDFTGKVALVTGASRGIGLGIAKRLAAGGAAVCITARKQEPLLAAAKEIQGNVITVAGAADDPEHRKEVFARIKNELGDLDVLVNNAGINPVYGPLMDLGIDAARKIVEVNVLGTLAWTQEAVKAGLGQNGRTGAVVNVSSVTGHTPSPGIGWYGITKAAVSHLTKTLAIELAPSIRVNAVAPAVVKTRFAEALYAEDEEAVASTYPMKRLGEPEDIAEAVAYLASDAASWVTAQVLTLDGGLITAGGKA